MSLRLTKLAGQKDMVSHPVSPVIEAAKQEGYERIQAIQNRSFEETMANARPLSSAPVEGEESHYQPKPVAADMEAETMNRASEMIAQTVHMFVEKQRAARAQEAAQARETVRFREAVI